MKRNKNIIFSKKLMNNPFKGKKLLLFLLIFIVLIISILSLSLKCSRKSQDVKVSESITSESETASTPQTNQKTQQETQKETQQETNQETQQEQIPLEIKNLIKDGDNYYYNGEYALAKSRYRKAELTIKESNLSSQTKDKLIASFYDRYLKSKNIVDTARIHYGNAMQLQYETNYEQALKELEKALQIYPKFQEAKEAYDSLKALMGLS